MFWKRRPGPTGTGKVIENINWYLWDDPVSPGLIHQSKFARLCHIALPENEHGDYATTKLQASIATSGRKDLKAATALVEYHSRVGDYLLQMRKNRREALDYWINSDWDRRLEKVDAREGLRLLKALLNVLGSWSYSFDWRDACDARGRLAVVIVSKKATHLDNLMRAAQSSYHISVPSHRIEYCVHEDEIDRVVGRPHQFTIEMPDAVWKFDHRHGDLVVTTSKEA